MATSKTIKPTNQTASIPAMTDAPDASVFADAISKTIDGVNALQDDHFTAKGSSTTPVNDLSTIPLGFVGNIMMAGAISPSGATRSHSLIKFGLSQNRYHIIALDQYANRIYLYENYDGTPTGWKDIPLGLYAFGGVSSGGSSNTYSFPMKDMSHAQIFIGATSTMMYVYSGTIYGATLPSGYTASYANGTVTITRDTSTTYIIHGIVIGGT